jgi:hypothetical protein
MSKAEMFTVGFLSGVANILGVSPFILCDHRASAVSQRVEVGLSADEAQRCDDRRETKNLKIQRAILPFCGSLYKR